MNEGLRKFFILLFAVVLVIGGFQGGAVTGIASLVIAIFLLSR
jgi:hypothetical protein